MRPRLQLGGLNRTLQHRLLTEDMALSVEKHMALLVERCGGQNMGKTRPLLHSLTRSIMGEHIFSKSSRVIWPRRISQ